MTSVAKEIYLESKTITQPLPAFSSIWSAFNNLFSRFGANSEIKSLRKYINSKIDEQTAKEIITQTLCNINVLIKTPVTNMKYQNSNTEKQMRHFYSSNRTDLDKLKDIVEIIYVIRCNNIHGDKSPTNDRDTNLCKNAYPVIEAIISIDLG